MEGCARRQWKYLRAARQPASERMLKPNTTRGKKQPRSARSLLQLYALQNFSGRHRNRQEQAIVAIHRALPISLRHSVPERIPHTQLTYEAGPRHTTKRTR